MAGDGQPEGSYANVLSVEERVAALVDKDSLFEIGGAARSQQPQAIDATARDGVLTAFGKIADIEVAVIADDPAILALTDGEVARLKRHRALTMALFVNAPIVLLLDGSHDASPVFDGNTGQLAGRMSDPRLDVDLGRRSQPLVTVLLGSPVGWARDIAAESDIVIAAPTGLAQLGVDASAIVDVIADDDRDALATARKVIELLGSRRHPENAARFGDSAVRRSVDPPEDRDLLEDPERVIELLVDSGTFVAFTRDGRSGLHTGLARIGAWPVVMGVTGGLESAVLSSADLHRLRSLYELSGKYNIPLLLVQDCAGYGDDAANNMEALASLSRAIRGSDAPAISIVTGRGHTLGKFPLGSKQLGAAFIIAWPWAQLAAIDSPSYTAAVLNEARQSTPWLAAGRGLVDDVLTPIETVATVRRLVALFSERWQKEPKSDRPNEVIA
jgi:methylmalonyl-CoA carboxyltransferase large subunit